MSQLNTEISNQTHNLILTTPGYKVLLDMAPIGSSFQCNRHKITTLYMLNIRYLFTSVFVFVIHTIVEIIFHNEYNQWVLCSLRSWRMDTGQPRIEISESAMNTKQSDDLPYRSAIHS